jgi:hypothetical protein
MMVFPAEGSGHPGDQEHDGDQHGNKDTPLFLFWCNRHMIPPVLILAAAGFPDSGPWLTYPACLNWIVSTSCKELMLNVRENCKDCVKRIALIR